MLHMREFMPVTINIGRTHGYDYHRPWVQWMPIDVLLNNHVVRLSLNIYNYVHEFVLLNLIKETSY